MSGAVTQYPDLQPEAFPEHSLTREAQELGSRPRKVQGVEAVSHRERAARASGRLVRAPPVGTGIGCEAIIGLSVDGCLRVEPRAGMPAQLRDASDAAHLVLVPPLEHTCADEGEPTRRLTLAGVDVEPGATGEAGTLQPGPVPLPRPAHDLDRVAESRV